MLILNRQSGEAIVIAGEIRIVVLSSDRRGVRIGIEAPAHVRVQREELVVEVAAEHRRASAGSTGAAWAVELPLQPPPAA